MKAKTLLPMTMGCGTGITILTGLIPNFWPYRPFSINYGYPLAWLTKTLDHLMSNQYFWQVNMLSLVADIIVWAIITFILVKTLGVPRFALPKH